MMKITRKRLVLYLGIIVTSCALIGMIYQLNYWEEIEWNLISLSFEKVALAVIGDIAYLGVLYFSKNKSKALWAIGVIWTVYSTFVLLKLIGVI